MDISDRKAAAEAIISELLDSEQDHDKRKKMIELEWHLSFLAALAAKNEGGNQK